MKQNTIFKIISSLMILITILSIVNATTISNSLSTFSNNIDMGTKEFYNATNINATNFYANGVLLKPDTNNFPLSIQVTGTGIKTLNLERNGTTNITAQWPDIDTDTWYNVTSVQVTGSGTKTLNVEQLGGIANRTASWTDIDTDTVFNTTSIQVTGTTTKTLNLEQIGIANRTASWTDIDTDTTYINGTGLNLTGTTFYLDLNYVDGAYVKRNTWTTIDNYPTGCSAGQYISTIGDTLTCSAPADLNFNVSSIQFTGTGTKTLNLEQIGIANRTATFTDLDTVYNTTSIQFTGTGATKTFTLEQTGSSAITNKTATFTDLTNSSADMIFAINNTNGVFTMQGLNISIKNINMNTQNITFTLGEGIVLNQSQSHKDIYKNATGCTVIEGITTRLNLC